MPCTYLAYSILRQDLPTSHCFLSRYTFTLALCIAVRSLSFAQSLNFTPERGFYSAPFAATLITDLPNASIKYTTNSDWPSDTQGTIYTGPIQINTTTVLKAIAYNSTDTTKLKTHSYIFLNDVVNQPAGLSIYPPETEMDPDIVNDPQYSSTIFDGLTDIMTISISLPEEDFIDPITGIYANPFERGRDWEREASMEFILTDGEHLQENMGIRVHGGASRGRDKKAFRVLFRDEYGPKKLSYPLFGQEADQSIDALVLRCRGGNSWVHSQPAHRDRAQLYRDEFARELQGYMGHVNSKGVQAHLYINGYYWGQYNAIEFFNQSFMASYLNGEEEDYEIWNHSGQEDGLVDTWTPLHTYITPGITSAMMYDSIASLIDLENIADYFLLNFYGGNNDWDTNNWYASKSYQPSGKWRFFAWDNEQFFKEIYWDVTDKYNLLKPSIFFNKLIAYPDFKQLFMDRVNCHFENDGVLSPIVIDSLWMQGFEKLGLSMIPESARWGDNKRPLEAYSLNNEYLTEQARLRNDYFPIRNDTVYNQMIRRGFYDDTVLPVLYSSQGGQVANGFQLSLTNPNTGGTLYYTLDGTDPRSPGGAIAPNAIVYTSMISINEITEVRARVLWNGKWSPNCPVQFFPPQDYSGIAINEIHYNPNDKIIIDPITNLPDTISGRNFEFIELTNGGSHPINLGESYFSKGISFTFDIPTIIQPNEFIVLADDEYWFEQQYGCVPDGTYNGKLDNGGENLWLVDPFGNIIDSLRYNDKAPWPGTADKGFYSLALKDATLDNALATNWSIQSVFYTPKAENYFTNFGSHGFSGIVINEIHYNPADSINTNVNPPDTINGRKYEFVELKNISAAPINLTDVIFSRGIEYAFPSGTIINPGEFIVLAEDKSSFEDRYGFQAFDKYDGQLDNGGETLWLSKTNGVLLDVVDYEDGFPWDAQADGGAIDYSLALIDGEVHNNTRLNWKVQCASIYTPGEDNDFSCFTGLDYTGLAINELHYNPSAGSNFEFIEITNHSTVPMDLDGVSISNGIFYFFESHFLPGAPATPLNTIVLAKDSASFLNTYGFAAHGTYVGVLSNSGETIILQDLFGELIDEVTYDDMLPWDPVADQGAKSLALLSGELDNNLASSWCTQDVNLTPKGINTFGDTDNDMVLDCQDQCPGQDDDDIGLACDDGDPCTTGETYDSVCNCTGGQFQDADSDGVCDANDLCPGSDDLIDTDNNGIPDGCEDCADEVIEMTHPLIDRDTAANLRIITNGKVIAIYDIDYHAAQSVELLHDFEVEIGSVFHAYISPCQ